MPDEVTLSIEILITGILLVINILIIGPVGYLLRQHISGYKEFKVRVYSELDGLEEKHNELRRELPDKYVSIERYLKEMDEIRQLLHRILDKLEGKADK